MTTQTPEARKLRTHLYKACRRCGGDLVLDREVDFEALGASSDYVCLQCGRRTPLRMVAAAAAPAAARPAVPVRAA